MKVASVDTLLAEVDRPGIENHLVPLLYYRGRQSLGNIHRYWNFLLSMRAQEAESMSDGTRMSRNGDYAHLCGPHTVVQMCTMRGFLSRLIDNKAVADNVPGLHDYARYLLPNPFILSKVPVVSHSRKHAWWRTYEPRPGSSPEEKARRAALRQRSKDTLFYPFAVHDPGRPDDGFELTKLVNSAVPKRLPPDRRADICQDLIVAILTGEISRDEVRDSVRAFTRKIMKMHPTKYGDISLDAMLRDGDDRTGYDLDWESRIAPGWRD